MRISEIIVESKGRRQLDEGMMDTIKSKLSGVYQMARKKYPNFDEVFAVAKSHKAETNDIIEQLKAKKEAGNLSKEDIVAAIMPLSKKIASEVGGKGVVNEFDQKRVNAQFGGIVAGGGVGGFLGLIATIFTLFNIDGEMSGLLLLGIPLLSAIIGATLGSESGKSSYDNEAPIRDKIEKSIEKDKQYFAHLATNGARTAQEKDDYNRLYDKYGYRSQSGYMSNVDIEKYERDYRDRFNTNTSSGNIPRGGLKPWTDEPPKKRTRLKAS